MNNWHGRKHNWVCTISSWSDEFWWTVLGTDNSMNDGYIFPCCQLIVPKVCCNMIFTSKIVHSGNTNILWPLPSYVTSVTDPIFDLWLTVHWSWSWPDSTSIWSQNVALVRAVFEVTLTETQMELSYEQKIEEIYLTGLINSSNFFDDSGVI